MNKLVKSITFVLLCLIWFSCTENVESVVSSEELLFELRGQKETGINFSNDLQSTAQLNIVEYLYYSIYEQVAVECTGSSSTLLQNAT